MRRAGLPQGATYPPKDHVHTASTAGVSLSCSATYSCFPCAERLSASPLLRILSSSDERGEYNLEYSAPDFSEKRTSSMFRVEV
jgi:hypothetical protein